MSEAPHGTHEACLIAFETGGAELPRHDDFSLGRRVAELTSIATAVSLLVVHLVRMLDMPANKWWLSGIFVIGAFAADFVSGLVHWGADTWGRETIPVIGRRLLRPFRVHHVNPDFYPRLESLISGLTGARPREDDSALQATFLASSGEDSHE
jgi:Lipid desaturase domain